MAQFCFLGLVKAQESTWLPGRFWNPEYQNSLSRGDKVSFLLLIPVSWHLALSQLVTHLETREGWVWLWSIVGPS